MSALASGVPSLSRHKASGQGVVRIDGVDHYLGSWPSGKRKPPPEVQSAYDARIAEWLAGGRRLSVQAGPLTVSQLIEAFWQRVEVHYHKPDGSPTSEVGEYRLALRPLRHLYADLPAAEFSPLKLKAVRQLMVDGYIHPKYGKQGPLARKVINKRISRIVSAVKWAAGEELVSAEILHGLKAVRGLEQGRTDARETEPVTPVAVAIVEATLPFLSPTVAAMVRLQLLTGMRPGEVCILRTCDLDMGGAIWFYRPKEHKTQHKGKDRIIAIGPRAQEVIRPFLRLDTQAYLFSPRDAVETRIAAGQAKRRTPLSCGNRAGTNRKPKPKRQPGDRYGHNAYRVAIARAAERADREARKNAVEEAILTELAPAVEGMVFVPSWHPHQLRHTHATEVRRKYGLEAAQVAMGHAQANVTQIYAERDLTLAARVAAEMG